MWCDTKDDEIVYCTTASLSFHSHAMLPLVFGLLDYEDIIINIAPKYCNYANLSPVIIAAGMGKAALQSVAY